MLRFYCIICLFYFTFFLDFNFGFWVASCECCKIFVFAFYRQTFLLQVIHILLLNIILRVRLILEPLFKLTHWMLHAIIVSAVLTVFELAGKIADAVAEKQTQTHTYTGRKLDKWKDKFENNNNNKGEEGKKERPWLTAHLSRWCSHCWEWNHRNPEACTECDASSLAWA